ncbi:MAG TPA: hypothetical protein PKG60_01105 [Spirochaetota bacterium]|nr:hypothetical protein [Spirochaetota bacterium]HPS85256.1 hypothetical protein [Spirochaetota bacterium]
MKINQIPDIYIEQYLLGELPENLRNEMDELIAQNPGLNDRISRIKKSNGDILSGYPAGLIVPQIIKKINIKGADLRPADKAFNPAEASTGFISALPEPLKNIVKTFRSVSSRRYTLSLASAAAAMILVIIFMIPGTRNTVNIDTPYDDTVRIKGLDSKLLLYRMKGKEIEELKNMDTARSGDIIQVGYIASGNYKYGVILSIDGRGSVTMHLPDESSSGKELDLNKRILLNKSYELDNSPSFERFIMILSADPINSSDIIEKAKKLAKSRESAVNGLIGTGKDSIEFSITIKKTE